MANIYDDEQNPKGSSSTKEPLDADDLRNKEKQSASSDSSDASGLTGGWWNDSSPGADDGLKGAPKRFFKAAKSEWSVASWRKKIVVASAGSSILVGLIMGAVGIFNFMNVFQLDHLLSNIERKGFIRYQVATEGRSNKWLVAYLMLRMGEVEDKSLKPADRDNIIFRANKVSTGNPATDWYKTVRASKFEEDLWEKDEIKFASVAYRDGNMIKFRPAIITIKDAEVRFEPTKAEIKAIENGDINGFNNRLRQFVEVQVLENDKAGRKAVKEAVNANTKRYQVIKRYYLRKSIQNMTGIRDWRFFENTRDKFDEKKINIRNKIIAKAFPESSKSGKFIQCMFGITECKTSTDPSNPANRSNLAPITEEGCSNNSGNPECNTGKVDDEGKPVTNDGSAEQGLTEGVSGSEDISKSFTKKMLSQVLSKLNAATGILSFIDTLNNINNNIKNGSLSAMVYMARATQAIGLYTTLNIMRDQIRTGDNVSPEEVNAAMEVVSNAGSSEGWQTLVANGDASGVSAAASTYEAAKSEKEYCSAEHQEQMLLPENAEKAKYEYHYLCPSEKIGGDNLAKDIEDGWNSSIGVILSPILAVYEGSGLKTIVGWYNSAVEAVLGPIMKATIDGVLGALGLKDDFQNLMGWLMTKAASVLGAVPTLFETSPPGVYANHAFMGAGASAEFAMRYAGAPVTTDESRGLSQQNVIAFEQDEHASMSFNDKYLSLANINSLASRSLFAVANQSTGQNIRSAFASIINLPATILGGRAKAATQTNDPYGVAKFAGLETYDFPATCMNQDPLAMTPQSSTNADDMGLIPADELTWDLVTNHDNFFNRLYENDPDPEAVKKVYNCELLDVTVRGGYARYNDKLLGPNAYGAGFAGAAEPTTTTGNIPTGDAKTLAQRILDHPNISFQLPAREEAMEYIAKTGHGRDCGAPAVSPTLLGVILAAAEKYKIVLGVVVDGHSCNNGFHPKGMAVDINGVNPLSGSGGTGNRIEWTSSEQGILKQFYEGVSPILTKAGGGGLGQIQCFSGSKPAPSSNVTYFEDGCNHIHMDVGKR